MKNIFIFIFIFISFMAKGNSENRSESLLHCLNQQDQYLNHQDSEKGVSAAILCMSEFLSEVKKEKELKLITDNLNVNALMGFINPYSFNSSVRQNMNLSSYTYGNNFNSLGSYNFDFPIILPPEFISQETQNDGDKNVFYGEGVDGGSSDFNNSAFGYRAAYGLTSGDNNVVMGYQSLYSTTSGSANTALGYRAGGSNVSGSGNVFIGNLAGFNETGSDKLYISNDTSQELITGDFVSGYLSLGRAGLSNGGVGIYGDLGIQFMDDDASHYVALVAPSSVSSSVTWTLPGADGSNGQVLTTNGSGTLSWSSVSSSDSDTTNSSLALNSGTLTLTDSAGGTVTADISGINSDTNTTNSSLALNSGTLTLTDSAGGTVTADISGINSDTNDFLTTTSLSGSELKLTMNSGKEFTQDLGSLSTGSSTDTNTFLKSAVLDGSSLVLTLSDSTSTSVDLSDASPTNKTNIGTNTTDIATNTTDIATNRTNIGTNTTDIATNKNNIAATTAEIATYTDSIAGNTTSIAALGSDLSTYKASTNSQMNYMKSDYSSGIASAIAMSQFNLTQEGFSVGIGRGSYNDENETAFGLGYGGEFKNGTLFRLQASKSGDASGVGLTISF